MVLMVMGAFAALLLASCDEVDAPVSAVPMTARPLSESVEVPSPQRVEVVGLAEVDTEADIPVYQPSAAALAAATRQLERRIRAATPVSSAELWTYVHENGTDNEIAEVLGNQLVAAPEPRRSCGVEAQQEALREFAVIRDDRQAGLRPQLDCRAHSPYALCDYTSNAHYTMRFVVRLPTEDSLELWAIAQLGSRYVATPGDPPPAGVSAEERDFDSFLQSAEADPCVPGGARPD